ncbi:MAG: efflux RND transporter periplasmic adaptor subunit [Woeseiaceae bacterium]|nr:efflux RND transporter periplasmic adaptor subunit [Woeseiaceae bacterium]
MKRISTGSLAAIVAAAATLQAGCEVGEASIAAPAESALPVEVSLPARRDLLASYRTTSTLSSEREATVPARVEGEVVELLVEEGDEVAKGQPLARLDGERLRLRMQKAKSNLDQVRNEYQRFVRLHKDGLVSTSALDTLDFEMQSLEAAYRLQRLNYEYTVIRAPIAGVVSAREIKVGHHVGINDPLFRITDTSELVAYLKIPQTELQKFTAGHPAKVRVDAFPELDFDASIARVSPTIDMRNGTFRATVRIGNDDKWLAPGMFGRFEIAYEKHLAALTVPLAALVREDNETVVYVVEDGSAIRRVIRTGIQSGEVVEVLDGLEDHEQVVVTGHASLRDGSRVFANIEPNKEIRG